MVRDLVKRLYRMIPGVRELAQMRDFLYVIEDELTGIRREVHQIHGMEGLRCLDFDLPQHPRYSDPLRLIRYEFQVCSQNGEDGVIREIFRRLGTTDRNFVEVGVGDGLENNMAFLLAQGWKGYCLDGDPQFLEVLDRAGDRESGRVKSLVSLVTRENVASLFEEMGRPARVRPSLDRHRPEHLLHMGRARRLSAARGRRRV